MTDAAGPGLTCPRCGTGHPDVEYTRQGPGPLVRRVRACARCGLRMMTYERIIAAFSPPGAGTAPSFDTPT